MTIRAEVRLFGERLRHNFSVACELARGAQVYPVIKANAYGHGMDWVAGQLENAPGFSVALPSEAAELRAAGCAKPLLVIQGGADADEWEQLAQWQCDGVLHSATQLAGLRAARLPLPLGLWIKVDTGMHRLGVAPADVAAMVSQLTDMANVKLLGLLMHFACADDVGHPLNALQVERLQLINAGLNLPLSVANSAALFHFELPQQVVRPGIMIYGASPLIGRNAIELDLQPVMELYAGIIAERTIAVGESVGYGAEWVAERETRVAVVGIGYGDGYPRWHDGKAKVFVEGECARIIGRVSMDSLMIDVTDIPAACVGSRVEMWGRNLLADDVARHANTISYELFCQLTPRVPRMMIGSEQ